MKKWMAGACIVSILGTSPGYTQFKDCQTLYVEHLTHYKVKNPVSDLATCLEAFIPTLDTRWGSHILIRVYCIFRFPAQIRDALKKIEETALSPITNELNEHKYGPTIILMQALYALGDEILLYRSKETLDRTTYKPGHTVENAKYASRWSLAHIEDHEIQKLVHYEKLVNLPEFQMIAQKQSVYDREDQVTLARRLLQGLCGDYQKDFYSPAENLFCEEDAENEVEKNIKAVTIEELASRKIM